MAQKSLFTALWSALLIQSLSQTIPPTSSWECSVSFNDIETTFNVCPLKMGKGTQREHYETHDIDEKYHYYFDIGGAFPDTPPDICLTSELHAYCPDSINQTLCVQNATQSTIPITDNAWAYQVEMNGNRSSNCYYLSNAVGGPPSWSLINDLNPVEGVRLTYSNGDFSPICKKNREFSINFECENTGQIFNPTVHSNVYEYSLCSYTWSVPSVYGCPIECPQNNFQLCSGNGLCSFDQTHNKSRCYCYQNYEGNDCSIGTNHSAVEQSTLTPPQDSSAVHTFHHNGVDITYDVTPWVIDVEYNQPYQVLNEHSAPSYIYYFGVMRNISVPSVCQTLVDSDVDQAYVFQLNNETKECYVLGTVAKWSLFDTIDDPARGFTITYTNGSACGTTGKNREFSVSLVCPDGRREYNIWMEMAISSRFSMFVEETETCVYHIEVPSAYACPYQCITQSHVQQTEEIDVCSNQGKCVADPVAGFVRCLCDETWHGAQCEKKITDLPTKSPTKVPSKKPTNVPTKSPTVKPTASPLPTQEPSVSPTKVKLVVREKKSEDNHAGFVVTIVMLCLGLCGAIFIGRWCYRKMWNQHEEFKEYLNFKEKTSVKKSGASVVGFEMQNVSRLGNFDALEDDSVEQVL